MIDHAVRQEIARGGRVESQSASSATVAYGKPVNHVLHLLLCVPTCGVWAFVWAFLALVSRPTRVLLSVAPNGQLIRQEVKA
jgi:dihydroxyacid dehydratase/phosphogluconate dehydratase